jgi:hypothetical protein
MPKRLCTMLAAIASAYFVQLHLASGTDLARPLDGQEVKSALIGNTLIGADGEDGVSWVYFPSADVLWGQSPTGDVDIGHWWIENDSYCRAWRRWLKAETKCWQLGSAADGRILWYALDGGLTGRSLLWHGNALSNLSDRFLTQTADAAANLNELEPQSGTMPRPRAQADSEQGFTRQTLGHGTDAASPSPAIADGETNALGMRPMSSPVTGGVLDGLAVGSRRSLDPRREAPVETAPAPAPERAPAAAAEPDRKNTVSSNALGSASERSHTGSGLAHDSNGDSGGAGRSGRSGGTGRD